MNTTPTQENGIEDQIKESICYSRSTGRFFNKIASVQRVQSCWYIIMSHDDITQSDPNLPINATHKAILQDCLKMPAEHFTIETYL